MELRNRETEDSIYTKMLYTVKNKSQCNLYVEP